MRRRLPRLRERKSSPVSPALGAGEQLESRCLLAVNVLQPIPAQTLPEGSTQPVEIDLAGRFRVDDIAGTVVRVNVNAPGPTNHFHIELFDAAGPTRTTPAMAANFLRYVDDGSYAGTIIHRSAESQIPWTDPPLFEPFVIQGGGFTAPIAPSNQFGAAPAALATKGTVVDEVGNPNVRGTLAMAKPSQNGVPVPDSATNQWFVNLKDNSFLNPNFSAFARVLGTGMEFVDALAAVPVYQAAEFFRNGALNELPLWQITETEPRVVVHPADFVTITGISRVASVGHSIVGVGDPALVTASITNGRLAVQSTGLGAGSTTVTVRATSVLDPADFADQTFTVTVPDPVAETLATVRGVTLARSSFDRLLVNGTPITLGNAPVSFSSMQSVGYTAVAAGVVNGENRIVWRTDAGILHHWRLGPAWDFASSFGWQAPGTTPHSRSELAFGMDFDGNGRIPVSMLPGVLFERNVNSGALTVNGTPITLGNAPVSFSSMQSVGYTAIAAGVVNSEHRIVWRTDAGILHHWRLGPAWDFASSFGWQAPGTTPYNRSESVFEIDFDGNGVIGG